MFYPGWDFVVPTFMNVDALHQEQHHTGEASDGAAAYVTQTALPDDRNRRMMAAEPSSGFPPTTTTSSSLYAADESQQGDAASGRRKKEKKARRCIPARVGCVLHLSAKAALSFKEMEQQLHRRATGASDCFHVKSDVPVMAQAAVVFMECVVVEPPSPSESVTNCPANPSESQAARAHSTRPPVTAAPTKPGLPALVIGVCQRSLEWYHLPGEAENSAGFYAAQRLLVKNGLSDGDAVKVPDGGRSGAGGGRISVGDHIGCLVDVVRHQLSFTVNRDVVAVAPLDPNLADGYYFFAIGLSRRPPQAMDVAVRFYSGASCLLSASRASEEEPELPVFPLTEYVRALAVGAVESRTLFLSKRSFESHTQAGPASSSAATAAAHVAPTNGEKKAREVHPKGRNASWNSVSSVAPKTAANSTNTENGEQHPSAAGRLSAEALRDTRVAAVIRSYLSVRGMANTLQTFDMELLKLAPSQRCLYAEASSTTAAATCMPSSSHMLWRPPLPHESQEAWQHHAADLHRLCAALFQTQIEAPNASSPLSLSALLSSTALWRPSLVYAFAANFEGYVAAAIRKSSTPLGSSIFFSLPALESPYDWLRHTAHPSLFMLSTLALRQDTRYVVSAFQAVEEMWGIIRGYLRAARAVCLARGTKLGVSPKLSLQRPPSSGVRSTTEEGAEKAQLRDTFGDSDSPGNGSASATGHLGDGLLHVADRPFAPSLECERQVHAAFTAYFTQLMWDSRHVLPSPMMRLHHESSSCSSSPPQGRTEMESLAALSLRSLAAVAGCPYKKGGPPSPKAAQRAQRGACREAPETDDREFVACAAACAASLLRRSSHPPSTGCEGNTAAPDPQKQPPPLYAAYVEEAVLILFRSAVVPAPAPPRSSQVCLLQTLCSLLAHVTSTLRQLERFVDSEGVRNTVTEDSAAVVQTALQSIDALQTLMDSVQQRYRQETRRHLVHTIEDVNQQLESRLEGWKAARLSLQSSDCSPTRSLTSRAFTAVRAGPRRRTASMHGRRASRGAAAHDTETHEESPTVSEDEAPHLEGQASAGGREDARRSPSRSLTASMSSWKEGQPSSSSEGSGLHQDGEVGRQVGTVVALSVQSPLQAPSTVEWSSAFCYETVTAYSPTLRTLWRRVAAKAVLEPSWHLVTELLMHELRRSLTLAPSLGWSRRSSATVASASPEEAYSTSAATGAPTAVMVKRPFRLCSAVGKASPESSRKPLSAPHRAAGAPREEEEEDDEGASNAVARWFVEELFLSSVYMRRVLKYMVGLRAEPWY